MREITVEFVYSQGDMVFEVVTGFIALVALSMFGCVSAFFRGGFPPRLVFAFPGQALLDSIGAGLFSSVLRWRHTYVVDFWAGAKLDLYVRGIVLCALPIPQFLLLHIGMRREDAKQF